MSLPRVFSGLSILVGLSTVPGCAESGPGAGSEGNANGGNSALSGASSSTSTRESQAGGQAATTGGTVRTGSGGASTRGSSTTRASTAQGSTVPQSGNGGTTSEDPESTGGTRAQASSGGAAATAKTKSAGGSSSGGASSGSSNSGGSNSGQTSTTATSGGSSGASSSPASNYPCGGSSANYNAVATKTGDTWNVTNSGKQLYSGTNLQEALTAAYRSLGTGRTTKQSILVDGSGDIPASAQLAIPSYTILNVCGTINVSGTASGSDRSPFYARNARDIEIPNLKMTGAPQYGIFLRQTDNIHLGQIDLRLSSSAGIGIRIDSGPSASTMTTFNTNLTIDHVYGSGMGSHIVETYGISDIKIGTIEGANVGECGLLLNRSIHAEIELVSCEDCATGTGYAAFRIANDVGKVGSSYPADNIHVKKVVARGGGRGIFSVSGSGGLTIDEIDIADTGSTPILLQNCYNTTIAAVKGTVSKGLVQLSNDTEDTNDGKFPPSEGVTFSNLTLSNGASIRQDWCKEFGSNGCKATNVTGGTVSMCP